MPKLPLAQRAQDPKEEGGVGGAGHRCDALVAELPCRGSRLADASGSGPTLNARRLSTKLLHPMPSLPLPLVAGLPMATCHVEEAGSLMRVGFIIARWTACSHCTALHCTAACSHCTALQRAGTSPPVHILPHCHGQSGKQTETQSNGTPPCPPRHPSSLTLPECSPHPPNLSWRLVLHKMRAVHLTFVMGSVQ